MSPRRQLLLAAGLVFTVALGVRLAHLGGLHASWSGTPLFDAPRGDTAHHWYEAIDILDENFFLTDRMLWKGPGYSYFLAGLMSVFGRSVGTLRWVMAALGALNCVGLLWLAHRLLPLRWAVVTALLAALNGILVLFDGELLFPTLLIALNLPVLAVLGRRSPSRRALGLAGLCAGLATLVHPVYLLPAAATTIWGLSTHGRRGWLFTLAVVLTVLPVSIQNFVQRGQPVLISWSGGVNLYIGNQPGFDQTSGQSTAAWGRVLKTPPAAGLEREYERDRKYYALTLAQLGRSPADALRILATKLRILLSPVEIANNIQLYELTEHSPGLAVLLGHRGLLWWPFGLWLPAVALGWLAAHRRGLAPSPPLRGALTWWMAGLALSIVLSFNTARYRAPLVFFGTLWAGIWIHHLWRAWQAGGARRLLPPAAGYLVLVGLVSLLAAQQRWLPPPLAWSEGRAREGAGLTAQAAQAYERALVRQPADPGLRLSIANFYGRQGRPQRQAAILADLLALENLEPDHRALAHEGLARAYLGLMRIDDARHHTREAMLLRVDDCEWNGRPYFSMGMVPATDCKLRLLAAEIELTAGDSATAGKLVEQALRSCPQARDLRQQAQTLAARIRSGGR